MLSKREKIAFMLLHWVHYRYDSAGINAGRSRISVCTESIFKLKVDEGLDWERTPFPNLLIGAKKLGPDTPVNNPFLPFADDDYDWLYQISDRELIILILVRLKKLYDEDRELPGDEHWSIH